MAADQLYEEQEAWVRWFTFVKQLHYEEQRHLNYDSVSEVVAAYRAKNTEAILLEIELLEARIRRYEAELSTLRDRLKSGRFWFDCCLDGTQNQ